MAEPPAPDPTPLPFPADGPAEEQAATLPCTSCGAAMQVGDVFCGECGAKEGMPPPAPVTPELATIPDPLPEPVVKPEPEAEIAAEPSAEPDPISTPDVVL